MALASLIENKRLILREAETVVWLMIFEDIVLVGFFILLSAKTTHPLVQIGAIALAVGGIFLLVRLATGPIRALLNRDDDLPLLFTFGIVIGAALFAAVLGIPSEIVAIAAGSALSLTSPASLERYARPFRDVFLVLFFVFFGISVDLAGSIALLPLIGLSLLAIASKLISAFAIGKGIHGSAASGIEIWSHTASRGEFSIALAAIYGSATVSATVAALVVLTSVAGAFLGRYSIRIRKILVRARRAAQ
jgi:CPA2 family monovalent cation:H+ antiporter-2